MSTATVCTPSSNSGHEKSAHYRKKIKEIMFLYFALLHGWRIEMLESGTFHFSRSQTG